MKKSILILLIFTAYLFSAVFDVTLFEKNKMDLAGRRNPVNDKTGNPCALIRVKSTLEELKFEGQDIVKKGVESSGKYYIYLSQTAKSIKLTAKNIEPMEFNFPIPLESTIVYDLELSKKDGLTDLGTIENIISSEHPEINGIINNLQVAPYNNDIISFEVKYDSDIGMESDKTVKLFLYNIVKRTLFRVESSKIEFDTSNDNKFYVKDKSLVWHPTKKWFAFNGNGYKNRENIYICKLLDDSLSNSSAIKGYLVDLYDQRNERSYCMYPSFSSNGKDLFFSRQVSKKDKKAKYNKSFNLAMIKNIFENEEQKFKNINFDILSEEEFDQFRVKCSPKDPNLVAYISYQLKIRNTDSFYAKYFLNIYDTKTSSVVTIDDLDGFRDYSFQWSTDGQYIFYNKAVSLARTDKDFIKDNINKVNLCFAKVSYENGKLTAEIQKNETSEILLEDVPAKDNGIAFLNENKVLISKYAPYNSLCVVDLQKWRDQEKTYYEKLDFQNDTDAPALTKDKLFYIEYTYPEKKTIVSVKSVGIER
ncbi:MAG: hypothetical protein JXR69_08765 [Candidatus Delongbacteria bacterium]|nr:hypothetical protein [Candidatus Delongbacteria bacterium]